MLVELECGDLRASISPLGAELRSLSLRGLEYLWPAEDPWKRTAPLLFPIVGRLNDDTLFDKGRRYTMAQHGFARDKNFRIKHVSQSTATFRLVSDQSTRLQYPFEFSLEATYTLEPDALVSTFLIENPDTEVLPASFGCFPPFDGHSTSPRIRQLINCASSVTKALPFAALRTGCLSQNYSRHPFANGC